jgi:phosphate-selective porin OprO/OprP
MGRTRGIAVLALTLLVGLAQAPPASAQQPQPANGTTETIQPPIDDEIDALESYNLKSPRRLVKWNEYEGPAFTIRVGGGYLYDYVSFAQDEVSKQQIAVEDQWKLRDARVLLSGRLKFRRQTTWSTGIMYDKGNDQWVFRQTGIMVSVPEIWGDIFVGRTKEGISLNKVMVGYGGWALERAPMNDAAIPILADGVKWLGHVPKARILWNFGVYGDAFSEGQGFSTYGNQIAGRFAWLPVLSTSGGRLVHIGVSHRYGKPKDGMLRLRSRPGAWGAPYFVDTEQFPADSTWTTGLEAYYRPGSVTIGSEFLLQSVDAPESGDPFFHGGEVFMSWLITGEVRSYNTRGGYFNLISPLRTVFSGGPGAWEVLTHLTYTDLDSGAVTGGKYWRFTPMVNWYLSDNARFEFAYGYGSLDRFDTTGKTHFLQFRLQLQI